MSETYDNIQQLLSKIETQGNKVKLPADSDVYPQDVVVLDEDGMVDVLPMVAEDEELLTNAGSITSGKTMLSLISRKVPAVKKPELLFEPDVEFLIAAIKTVTFTSEYEVNYTCQSCGTENKASFDSNEFPCVSYSKEDITGSVELKNGQNVKFMHLPIGEFLKEAKETQLTERERFIKRIASVDDISDKMAIKKWISAIKLPLLKEVRRGMYKPLGGFDVNSVPHSCEKCNHENKVGVNLLAGFFTLVLTN